jgi:hypothetical protein
VLTPTWFAKTGSRQVYLLCFQLGLFRFWNVLDSSAVRPTHLTREGPSSEPG